MSFGQNLLNRVPTYLLAFVFSLKLAKDTFIETELLKIPAINKVLPFFLNNISVLLALAIGVFIFSYTRQFHKGYLIAIGVTALLILLFKFM